MPSRRRTKPKKLTQAQIIKALEDPRPRPNEFGYIRVSTDDQSLDMQRDAMLAAGLQDRAIFEDVISGTTEKRPGLRKVFLVVGKGDTLVVWKLDRLGRSLQGVLDTIQRLNDQGCAIRSLTEPIDTSTPIGRAMMSIILVFAQMERELISERTKRGIEAYKARGGKMGPKHAVLDFPKRLALMHELHETGVLYEMEASQFVNMMNEADPDAKKINTRQMFYNWKRKGFKGFTPKGETDV